MVSCSGAEGTFRSVDEFVQAVRRKIWFMLSRPIPSFWWGNPDYRFMNGMFDSDAGPSL
jgi:hypothetical protein